MHTELNAEASRLLTRPWQHLGLDFHAGHTCIGGYQREEEACGLRARTKRIEGYADIGQKSCDHFLRCCVEAGRSRYEYLRKLSHEFRIGCFDTYQCSSCDEMLLQLSASQICADYQRVGRGELGTARVGLNR